jgi:ribosome-binding protein aMBF1 (putative translation factor)
MSLPHQDWETVVLRKPKPKQSTETGKPKPPEEGSEFNVAKAPTALKTAIQQGRAARGMSQDALASQLGVPKKLVQDYENGKGVPNNAFIVRIERVLKCKLPRTIRKKNQPEE